MGYFSRLHQQCYCAFCKSERRIYAKKHVSLTNVLAASFLATTLTYAYFGGPDPRGVTMFCIFVGIAEIFVYSRWRMSMSCNLCGFDPVIYKRSPEAAAQKVRAFYEEKSRDPQFYLSRSPLLEIQRKKAEHERKIFELKHFEARLKDKKTKALGATSKLVPTKTL